MAFNTSKYGNVLTIVLVTLIVAVLIGAGILVYNYIIKPNMEKKEIEEIIREFDEQVAEEKKDEPQEGTMDEDVEVSKKGSGQVKSKPKYKGFVMIGYISIPKTGVKYPILETLTNDSLNASVVAIYPSNPSLNEPRNVVIIGHNYKDGRFFSNNKKLAVGDKIQITDNTGKELTYTIYDKFEADTSDTSFYNRDTNGKPEITLSSCVDETGSPLRVIILARAE